MMWLYSSFTLPLHPVSVGAFPIDLAAHVHDGIYDSRGTPRLVTNACLSALDSFTPAARSPSPPQAADDNLIMHVSPPPLEGAQFTVPGLPKKEDVFLQSGVHRSLPKGVEGSVKLYVGEGNFGCRRSPNFTTIPWNCWQHF